MERRTNSQKYEKTAMSGESTGLDFRTLLLTRVRLSKSAVAFEPLLRVGRFTLEDPLGSNGL